VDQKNNLSSLNESKIDVMSKIDQANIEHGARASQESKKVSVYKLLTA